MFRMGVIIVLGWNQVAIIYCGTNGLLADVPVEKVGEFEKNFLEIMENKHKQTVLEPVKNGQLTGEIESILRSEAAALSAAYK